MSPLVTQLDDGSWAVEYPGVEGSAAIDVTAEAAAKTARARAYALAVDALLVAMAAGRLHPVQVAIVPGLDRKRGKECLGCLHLALTWYLKLQGQSDGPLIPPSLGR